MIKLKNKLGADYGFDEIYKIQRCMPRCGWPRKKPQKIVAKDDNNYALAA